MFLTLHLLADFERALRRLHGLTIPASRKKGLDLRIQAIRLGQLLPLIAGHCSPSFEILQRPSASATFQWASPKALIRSFKTL